MKIRSKPVTLATAVFAVTSLVGATLAASGSKMPKGSALALSSIVGGRAPALQANQAAAPHKGVMSDEQFKNIQVLKGIPVDDFMGTMGIMAASLAFCCRDCHVGAGTDTVVWEADNTMKRTARKMVTMVQTLNKENFNGRQVVTCWTCHRGRDVPVTTMEMDTVYGEGNVQLDDVLTPVKGMPSPDQLIDKYIQAVGGVQKVGALTSFVAKGTGEEFSGQGGKAQVEIDAKVPDQRATYLRFPDDPSRGDSTRTFDGRTGWVATPLVAVRKYEFTGGEIEGARLDAELSFPARIKQVLTNLRTGPDTSVNGHPAYVVQGSGLKGSLADLYFDRQSGLLLRIVRFVPSPIGRVPTQYDYDDYRDVNGVKMPFSIMFSWLDGRQVIKLDSVQVNVPIDAAKFGEPNPMAKP